MHPRNETQDLSWNILLVDFPWHARYESMDGGSGEIDLEALKLKLLAAFEYRAAKDREEVRRRQRRMYS
jgi:hypothetical protein